MRIRKFTVFQMMTTYENILFLISSMFHGNLSIISVLWNNCSFRYDNFITDNTSDFSVCVSN